MSIKYNGGYIPAVGADGTTLVANSSASTGVSWSAGTTLANPVLNSCFDIAQRGTSISLSASSSPYTLDRWRVAVDANEASTVSQQATGDTTNLPNVQYCLRYQRNSGQTGTNTVYVMQYNESTNCIPFAGKQITFSFYARAGANYSSASSLLTAALVTGTGIDQNLWSSGYTGQSTLTTKAATLTTTWQRFTVTATMPTNMTEFGYWFYFNPTGTAGTNDYFELTGVQIDVGSVALPVRRNGTTLQGELTACQRYYYRLGGAATYETFAQVLWTSTTAGNGFIKTAQTLRTNNPSVEFASLRALVCSTAGVAVNSVSNVTLTQNANGNFFNLSVTAGGSMVTGFTGWIDSNGTTAGYLALSSEL